MGSIPRDNEAGLTSEMKVHGVALKDDSRQIHRKRTARSAVPNLKGRRYRRDLFRTLTAFQYR